MKDRFPNPNFKLSESFKPGVSLVTELGENKIHADKESEKKYVSHGDLFLL